MKYILFLLLISLLFACTPGQQQTNSPDTKLSISPWIDQNDSLNKVIISTLGKFLASKNTSLEENEYWEKNDFQTYMYPYIDIYYIQADSNNLNNYRPTLLEIIDTDSILQKIVKIAFIKHDHNKQENQLDVIYNLIANQKNDKIIFSSYIDYATRNWKKIKTDDICYFISSSVKCDTLEIQQQQHEIQQLQHFFQMSPIPVIYYSCKNPVELFQTRGFDYISDMYLAKTGGIVYANNIIFAGNNSQLYTHEIAHLYINKQFPSVNALLNEGLATLLGGSGPYNYTQCKQKIKQYLAEHPDFRIDQHTHPYKVFYAYKEISIPYVIGALICERTLRLYGKEKLFELLQQKGDLEKILQNAGLSLKNLNQELRQEVIRPPLAIFNPSNK